VLDSKEDQKEFVEEVQKILFTTYKINLDIGTERSWYDKEEFILRHDKHPPLCSGYLFRFEPSELYVYELTIDGCEGVPCNTAEEAALIVKRFYTHEYHFEEDRSETPEDRIPDGVYCHGPIHPVKDPSKPLGVRFEAPQRCPYWTTRPDRHPQDNGFCTYLNKGDGDDGIWLLWDQVKACGIKDGMDEDE